jgi:large subunit ribosomal protein L29
MKAKELRELDLAELTRREKELRRKLLELRIQRANQQLKNPLQIRETRREIAMILTILREKKDGTR